MPARPDIWLTASETAMLLGITRRHCIRKCDAGDFVARKERGNGGLGYRIALSSLPRDARLRYDVQTEPPEPADGETLDTEEYNRAPEYNRRKYDKYATLLRRFEGLKGEELKKAIYIWNSKNLGARTSYVSICNARARRISLVGNWGNRQGGSVAEKYREAYDYFKSLYLVEGAPSVFTCWRSTLGFLLSENPGIDSGEFPRPQAFKRALDREVPASSQYLARYGQSAWNRKYGSFVNRDYGAIRCGQVWVSDHAQIDVAVMCPDGRVRFPWVTAWSDFKSGKFLGWILHAEDPNSDHIFMSFYYAAMKYGLPSDVIIDNGKDYRCRDFAGTRRVRVDVDEVKSTAMLSLLSITRHFALLYNAQAKPIERRFREIKEQLSKHTLGYRGGDVTERPEKLKKEIAGGEILTFNEFSAIFDDFIENVLNKSVSQGKNLLGKSPDMLWAQEFTVKREVSKDALRLFCMRTSRPVRIGRNGMYDSQLGVVYWGEWMASCKDTYCYLRRDPRDYATAWVFRADNDEYIAQARAAVFDSPALARSEIEKSAFKAAVIAKRKATKTEKAYLRDLQAVDPMTRLLYDKAAVALDGDAPEARPRISEIADTGMDRAVRKQKEAETNRNGALAPGIAAPDMPDTGRVYMYEFEKEDERQAV